MKSKSKRAPLAARPPATTIADLHRALDSIAPFSAAADWDNVGLLAGALDWPARRVLLTIDLTDAVATEALRGRHDTVIAYHPPIFKGIRSITDRAEAPTRQLPDLLRAGVSIFSVHTALDAAVGGTNDILLDAFDCTSRRPLEPAFTDGRFFKLAVYVPVGEAADLRRRLAATGAGHIGRYDECSFELVGEGTFRGDETTNPTIGKPGVLERVAESRLEMIVPSARLAEVVRAVHAHHSYEEPAFDLYPLRFPVGRGDIGMGRIGELKRPTRGDRLLAALRRIADLSAATIVGSLRRSFSSVTTAAGSFGVRNFRDPASLIVTGEMKHHDGLDLLRRGISAVVMGHYASERPALESLANRLRQRLPRTRFTISRKDAAPFNPISAE